MSIVGYETREEKVSRFLAPLKWSAIIGGWTVASSVFYLYSGTFDAKTALISTLLGATVALALTVWGTWRVWRVIKAD
ncbi:MAG TPA: hypothetical protein VI358_17995 [Pseudolabrys sp.]